LAGHLKRGLDALATRTVFVIDDPLMKDFYHKLDSVQPSGRSPFFTRGFGGPKMGCQLRHQVLWVAHVSLSTQCVGD